MLGRALPARDPPFPRDHHQQHRPIRLRPPRAARAHSARHRLHGGGDRAVRRHQRGVQVAGGPLSGRRGAVCARLRLPGRFQRSHPAADGPRRVPDAEAARSHHARGVAGDLADAAADCVQHDAAGERDRDQFLRAAVRHADVDPVPQGERRLGALDRPHGRLPRRAGGHQSGHRDVSARLPVRARQRGAVRHRHRRGARHDGDRNRARRSPCTRWWSSPRCS